jgi:pimeloyl-ACP methyl ester carboxylesterase
MKIKVRDTEVFVSTGARPFDAKGDVLLFIHGSGQSHLTWMLQSRYFANRNYQVLAPDLPGHYLSGGAPLESIEDIADWCIELLDAAGAAKASIIGHSQGGLVCLELASRYPERVKKMAIISAAKAVPVNDALIEMSQKAETRAHGAMISWSHAGAGHRFDHTMPGFNHIDSGKKIMNQNPGGALTVDLKACNNYKGGDKAAAAIACPSLCLLAAEDKMVPAKLGRMLAADLKDCRLEVIPRAGHFLPTETAHKTNAVLRSFFA